MIFGWEPNGCRWLPMVLEWILITIFKRCKTARSMLEQLLIIKSSDTFYPPLAPFLALLLINTRVCILSEAKIFYAAIAN